jgi:O-antigen/teichoic acid export membrane protein
VVAEPLMQWFYPNLPATPVTLAFQILLVSTGIIYLWAVFGNSLQACDQAKIYFKGFAWAAAFNIVLNLLAIPYFSLYGAAVATLLAQLFLLIFMNYHFTKTIAAVPLIKTIIKPLLAAISMAILLLLMPWHSVWLVIPGILIYIVILYMLGGVTKNDLVLIKTLWQKTPRN